MGEPFSIGSPATHTLSLIATVRPASGPSSAPGIEHRHTHPFDGFASPSGRWPGSARGYLTGNASSSSSSSRAYPAAVGSASAKKASTSSSVRRNSNTLASSASSSRDGGWIGIDSLQGRGQLPRPYPALDVAGEKRTQGSPPDPGEPPRDQPGTAIPSISPHTDPSQLHPAPCRGPGRKISSQRFGCPNRGLILSVDP